MAHSSNLAARAPELTWIGYLSSTSVYGDHKGEWVDEGSELLAAHGKGLSRMLAEGAWLALCYECQVPIHIFRCGGIYGPRRSALGAVQEAMASGRGGTATQERRRLQRYTSRCHVLDICRVLEASAARVRPGAIYNVVDDDPAGRGEVEEFAERLLREAQAQGAMGMWHERSGQGAIDLPSLEVLEDATRASSRAASGRGSGRRSSTARGGVNEVSRAEERWVAAHEAAAVEAASRGEKRVRNDLIKQELEVELEFPTYREGIAALLKGDMRPFD